MLKEINFTTSDFVDKATFTSPLVLVNDAVTIANNKVAEINGMIRKTRKVFWKEMDMSYRAEFSETQTSLDTHYGYLLTPQPIKKDSPADVLRDIIFNFDKFKVVIDVDGFRSLELIDRAKAALANEESLEESLDE